MKFTENKNRMVEFVCDRYTIKKKYFGQPITLLIILYISETLFDEKFDRNCDNSMKPKERTLLTVQQPHLLCKERVQVDIKYL